MAMEPCIPLRSARLSGKGVLRRCAGLASPSWHCRVHPAAVSRVSAGLAGGAWTMGAGSQIAFL